MAIIVEKDQGIRLPLASAVPTPLHQSREAGGYYKVRSYHGGGEFFQPENAQVILQSLGEFLPRAVERVGSDGRLEIFYQHLSNGHDVCSSTASLDSGVNVPKSEITRLEAAIAQFKAKENDSGTDPTKREIIRAFRLPSPQKDPELYRLYGSGGNRRLLVLWGVEKEAGSSLSPQEALNRVPHSKSSIPWWFWVLLALLLFALFGWWWSSQHPESTPGRLLYGNDSQTPVIVLIPENRSSDSPKASNNESGATAINSPSNSLTPVENQSAESPSKALMPVGTATGAPTDQKKGDAASSTPTEGSRQPPSTLTSRRSTTLPEDSKKPADPQQQPKPAESPKSGESKKLEPIKSGEPPPASMPVTATPIPPSSPSKEPSETPAPKPGMASNEPKGTEQPSAPLPQATPPSPNKLETSPPPVPLTAEIVNARTSAAPKDGKVEMQLSMLARDPNGKAITIAIVESWTVDGKPQKDDSGRPITTNGLPVRLTEGAHRVKVTGTADDGRKVSAEADVNVDIAVRQESTVRVKQLGKP